MTPASARLRLGRTDSISRLVGPALVPAWAYESRGGGGPSSVRRRLSARSPGGSSPPSPCSGGADWLALLSSARWLRQGRYYASSPTSSRASRRPVARALADPDPRSGRMDGSRLAVTGFPCLQRIFQSDSPLAALATSAASPGTFAVAVPRALSSWSSSRAAPAGSPRSPFAGACGSALAARRARVDSPTGEPSTSRCCGAIPRTRSGSSRRAASSRLTATSIGSPRREDLVWPESAVPVLRALAVVYLEASAASRPRADPT